MDKSKRKDGRRGHANAKGGRGNLTPKQTARCRQSKKKEGVESQQEDRNKTKARQKVGQDNRTQKAWKPIGRQEACTNHKEGRRREQANRKTEGWTSQ